MKLTDMTKDERSLLLYLETRMVDHAGIVNTVQMNADDFKIAERWEREGFAKVERRKFAEIEGLQLGRTDQPTHRCSLSEEAWTLAHEERRARAKRMTARETP